MIRLGIDGLDRAQRQLQGLARHAPELAARALNYTGREVRHALTAEIPQRFDRPTPYTQRGVRSTTARANQLYTDIGFVGDTLRSSYLLHQVEGGARPVKRLEYHMRTKGVLPVGMYVVPGAAARLDKYGNWSRGQINQVLSALGAQPDALANTDLNRTRKTRRGLRPRQLKRAVYWVGRPGTGRLPMGIWEIGGKYGGRNDRIRPIAIFVRQPIYRRRWDFYGTALRVAREQLPAQMRRLWEGEAAKR